MKLLLLLVALMPLLVQSGSIGDEEYFVGYSLQGNGALFFDRSSLIREADNPVLMQASVIEVGIWRKQATAYFLTHVEFDCENRTKRTISSATFDESGRQLIQNVEKYSPKRVTPETIGEFQWQFACEDYGRSHPQWLVKLKPGDNLVEFARRMLAAERARRGQPPIE